jgi:NADH:ubiquinone oxidoreductase subunit K
MGYVLATERGVDSSLAIFVLLILFFLSRYPVPLSRNVVVHSVVFSLFFLSNTLAVLLRSVFGLHVSGEISLFMMGISSACVVAWLVLLNAKGERMRVSTRQFGRGDEERILLQLDSLNDTLLRASHK